MILEGEVAMEKHSLDRLKQHVRFGDVNKRYLTAFGINVMAYKILNSIKQQKLKEIAVVRRSDKRLFIYLFIYLLFTFQTSKWPHEPVFGTKSVVRRKIVAGNMLCYVMLYHIVAALNQLLRTIKGDYRQPALQRTFQALCIVTCWFALTKGKR